jgi:glycosyltransferase involved in cell wall biosynthesis
MTLLYDLTACQSTRERVHGGGEYAQAVFVHLLERAPAGAVEAVWHPERPLPGEVNGAVQARGITLHAGRSVRDIQRLIAERRPRTFYSALPYKYYGTDFGETAFVMTVHGLRDIEQPSDVHAWRWARGPRRTLRTWWQYVTRRRRAERAKAEFAALLRVKTRRLTLVAASHHTQYALLTHFPFLDPAQVRVVYSPRPLKTRPGDSAAPPAREMPPPGRRTVLLINADRWIKNAYRAVRALDDLIARRDAGLDTVVLGERDGRRYGPRHKERFRFLPYVPDTELMRLYGEAFCFLYPTLNEGFGYPPLEAMGRGTPVIASATGPVPEVLGDAALYIDPLRPEEMQNRLLRLVHEPGLWQRLSERGVARAREIAAQQDAMEQDLIGWILDD